MDRARTWVYGIGGFVFGGLIGMLGPALIPAFADPNLMIILPPICAFALAGIGVLIARTKIVPATSQLGSASGTSTNISQFTWVLLICAIVIGLIVSFVR
jgi:hypothetical protein